ncbi:MAG: thioredoxin family protein, partial [Candidatus Babeliales bacterium]|nr:thioredoxin family protein [Candidatus Babeliales bacterium]
ALLLLTSRNMFAEVVNLASEAQYEEILKSGKPAVIKFGAEWCGACQSVKGAYADLANELHDVTFVDIDVDKFQPLAQKNGIAGIPTFLYVQNGSTKHQDVGVKNPATFKEDVKNSIKEQFSSVAAAHPAAMAEQHPAAPAATGHEMGMLAKLQGLFISAFYAVKNMFMDVIAKIKGLFGK